MGRPDDISGLFGKGPDNTPFRQGRLLTFNPATGANTILCQGSVLTNLALLIEGGAFNLQGDDVLGAGNGNVIIMMKMRSSWAILGRVLTLGDPNIINSGDISQAGHVSIAFATTTSLAAVISLGATVPAWANKAVIFSTFTATFQTPIGVATQANISLQHNVGATAVTATSQVSTSIPTNATAGLSISDAVNLGSPTIYNGVPLAGQLITIQGNAFSSPNAIPTAANTGFIATTIQYQKV